MKIKFWKLLNSVSFSSGLLAFVILASCAFPFQSPSEAPLQDISGELGYNKISRQAFMGGSVLYNPDMPSSGQLVKGARVAVRLGYVDLENGDSAQPGFVDRETDARYGYITINFISKEQIDFTYIEYAADGKSTKESTFNIALNQEADINGDGLVDITYVRPIRKRPGMEKLCT
jgi:hypothetical protein